MRAIKYFDMLQNVKWMYLFNQLIFTLFQSFLFFVHAFGALIDVCINGGKSAFTDPKAARGLARTPMLCHSPYRATIYTFLISGLNF